MATTRKATTTKASAAKASGTKASAAKASGTKASAAKGTSGRAGAAKGRETSSAAFTAEERAAMKEHAAEVRRAKKGADGEAELLAKIAEMAPEDRALAEQVHEIVTTNAPALVPRTWYGMPAYAKDGQVLCFFQPAGKFKARYATVGFNDGAMLDDGTMWPTAYALTKLTAADAKKLAALVKRAAGD